jgi:cation transport regulator ChaB
VAGVVLGVAGTVYATNEEVRKNLPKAARDLPENVRRRYQSAVSAAREASNRRREEILRDLEAHGGANHAARGVTPDPAAEPSTPDLASQAAATSVEQTTHDPE